MKKLDKCTEEKILDAAKIVFLKKGLDGARMQEIADEAKINKALLHYYFRSKDKLFDAIFVEAFSKLLPRIGEIMMSEKTFLEKIKLLIDNYIDLLIENPHLPIFVLHEISRNPERIIQMISKGGVNIDVLFNLIKQEIKNGTIINIKPQHLFVNIIGLCIFPFVGRPVMQGVIFKNDSDAYDKFLVERKKEIKNFVFAAIKK